MVSCPNTVPASVDVPRLSPPAALLHSAPSSYLTSKGFSTSQTGAPEIRRYTQAADHTPTRANLVTSPLDMICQNVPNMHIHIVFACATDLSGVSDCDAG